MHHQLGCKPVGLWHALTGFLHVPLNRAQLVSTATKYDQVVLETTSHFLKTQTLNFKNVFDSWKLHMSLEPTSPQCNTPTPSCQWAITKLWDPPTTFSGCYMGSYT